MKKYFVFILFFIFNISIYSQVTKKDIKQILTIYGDYTQDGICENEIDIVWNKYNDNLQFNTDNLTKALAWSVTSGISLGAYESYLFGYKHSEWLPRPLKQWYDWKPQTDAVFGKSLTWHKIFRAVDYSADRAAFNNWKKFYAVKSFWSWNQLAAYLTHFTVKNTMATIVRDKFKYNEAFHSFDFDLIFDFGDIIK